MPRVIHVIKWHFRINLWSWYIIPTIQVCKEYFGFSIHLKVFCFFISFIKDAEFEGDFD